MDITTLATQFGPTVAILLVGFAGLFSLYRAALAAKDKANQQLLDDRDDRIEKLEQKNTQLEEKVYRLLDRGEHLADLAGAPHPPPAVRRRRTDV